MKQSSGDSGFTQTIEITVNGQKSAVPQGQTVEMLLAHLGVKADRVAVELNKRLVTRRDWPSTPVPGGSLVEVVEFVGGG